MMKSRATMGADTRTTIIRTTATAHDDKATDEGQLEGLRGLRLISCRSTNSQTSSVFFSDFSSTTIEGHSLMEASPKKIRLAYSKNS